MSYQPPILSSCQTEALAVLQDRADNVFLTGDAGTGKSFLIRRFLKDYDRKTFPIVASTGVAAVLVGGRTFHSFFGLGIMEGGFERTVERALSDKSVVKRMRHINGFVLDEVSMIPAEALRAAEAICRLARHKNIPWGGARVVAVGDFAQLPPVSRDGAGKDWAFLSAAWESADFVPLVLKTMMRTGDAAYLKVLNRVRHGEVDDEVRLFLNERTDPERNEPDATHLFPTRVQVDRYNRKRLAEIDQPLREFATQYTGREWGVEQIKKAAPIPEILHLKTGALIMIRINDPGYKFVNGSVGVVREISENILLIELGKGGLIELEKATFSYIDADGREVGSATNFPVTLAYAMTIHKSQGVTLDKLVVDLRRLWEPGQAYVALSRLKSGDGLALTGWDEGSIRSDERVMAFHRGLVA